MSASLPDGCAARSVPQNALYAGLDGARCVRANARGRPLWSGDRSRDCAARLAASTRPEVSDAALRPSLSLLRKEPLMREAQLSTLYAIRHPLLAWRDFLQTTTDRADADALAAGLIVAVLPGGVRRYRDPRMDQLAARRAMLETAQHCQCCRLAHSVQAPSSTATYTSLNRHDTDVGWVP